MRLRYLSPLRQRAERKSHTKGKIESRCVREMDMDAIKGEAMPTPEEVYIEFLNRLREEMQFSQSDYLRRYINGDWSHWFAQERPRPAQEAISLNSPYQPSVVIQFIPVDPWAIFRYRH